eukprot:s461_g18.t1
MEESNLLGSPSSSSAVRKSEWLNSSSTQLATSKKTLISNCFVNMRRLLGAERLLRLSAHFRPGSFGFVFMDQRGSLYHEDLDALERAKLLHQGAVLLADNVLKPGSPLLLWRLSADPKYQALQLSMEEFAMPVEDWMALAVIKDMASSPPEVPAPRLLRGSEGAGFVLQFWSLRRELHEFSDEIRARALIPGRGIDFQEWKDLADEMKRGLHSLGITALAVEPSS